MLSAVVVISTLRVNFNPINLNSDDKCPGSSCSKHL